MPVVDVNAPKPNEVSDTKVEKQEAKEPSLVDKMLARQEQIEELKMVRSALGNDNGGNKGGDIATAIVTASVNQQNTMTKMLQDQIDSSRKALMEAQTIAANAQTELYNTKIDVLRHEQDKLNEAAKEASKFNPPQSQMEVYHSVRKEIEEELAKNKPEHPPAPSSINADSYNFQLELEKIRQEREKFTMDFEQQLKNSDREWSLRMLEFDAKQKREWAEYNDKKQFREQGMEGLQDLIGAVTSGIHSEMESEPARVSAKPKVSQAHKSSSDSEGDNPLGAFISQFACQMCGHKIPVKKGQESVACPNEECGAQYDILPT